MHSPLSETFLNLTTQSYSFSYCHWCIRQVLLSKTRPPWLVRAGAVFIYTCDYSGYPRLWIFRYKVTEVDADVKRRLRLGCMKEIRQPSTTFSSWPRLRSQITDLGIPYFFTCHTCLTSPQTSVLNVSRKYPGREKPNGFKPKGERFGTYETDKRQGRY